ncbi:Putative electron transport protein YccM [Anatilimnocola aggregata]|uniref:Electron transport protein YccM n=1 Tax=Anatilimnocola aggregata TaxID=2528021 RepID=A0A517YDB2_9BACT|nr:cytochrome c oxidase assembly protein [Anatilimnocola aggregata]QDU28230.1 Putative electron transport protein YccM [Anatilimnocola aggregata]
MPPTLAAFARSWPWDPWLVIVLVITAAIYARGFWLLHRRDPTRWPLLRLVAFLAGLATLFLALASPIEPFASLLLQVHMLQHLLLMMVVAPLVWLGTPLMPLLRGLPRQLRKSWFAPLLRSRSLQSLLAAMTHPFVALPLFTAMTWLWHLPRVYDAALRAPQLHYWQHVSFLLAGLLFWYPVVRPYPARPRWSPWLLLPYLLLADIQNTVLSALLTFSDRVLYSYYNEVPRIAGITALEDQSSAGVLMWVPGSIAFLGPLFWIGLQLLFGSSQRAPVKRESHPSLRILPVEQVAPFDLLHVPVLGHFLRWRYARFTAQAAMTVLAAVVIYDGLVGPQVGAMNLAGVLPWIHWRGLLVLGLLVAGNFFCFACPFTLPRALARRWLPQGRAWPTWLRSKWLAAGLLVLFLWSYEAFSLWDSPWLTAWITVGYFVAAFTIEGFFRGGSFCKYVCPIGQFNFVQSLISPLEVRVRRADTCANCTTHDCLKGNATNTGCELQLFQPRKGGNMDCTFCLDCVQACPQQNVGILATTSVTELWSDRWRSGVGRFSQRPDLAALVLVLVFGAFANAAGMVGPVVDWQNELSSRLGQRSHWLTSTLFYSATIVALPLLAVVSASALNRLGNPLTTSRRELATRFAFAFVPLGFAMWLAHYSFHFLTSSETIVPVTQRFTSDLGFSWLGSPLWSCACCRPLTDWLLQFELLALDVGLLASLYVVWKIAGSLTNSSSSTWKIAAPWAGLVLLLFALGVWIVFQPMQMRGTLPGGG